jgi:hypothetical protein
MLWLVRAFTTPVQSRRRSPTVRWVQDISGGLLSFHSILDYLDIWDFVERAPFWTCQMLSCGTRQVMLSIQPRVRIDPFCGANNNLRHKTSL